MSEGTLASAVSVPEQDVLGQSPAISTKRRQSSTSEHDTKRRRLSAQDNESPQSQRRRSSPAPAEQSTERRPARSGREEERKRGQRLFGALLGTLSQSSNSAAQKRRADIEKKQRDKLKVQAEEYGELKKRRKERRDAIRRKEKPFHEREAMRTRHANMIAMAHFLKTKTEPPLYYKPWQLRPGDEIVIREQIEDAEATVSREVAEFEARYPPEAFVRQDLELALKDGQPEEEKMAPGEPQQEQEQSKPETEQVPGPGPGPETETAAKAPQATAEKEDRVKQGQNSEPIESEEATNGTDTAAQEQTDAHHDDGGEVVEDNEDTVIY